MPPELLSPSTPIVLQRENSQGWLGVQPCSPQARMSSSGSTRPTQPPSERHSREQERAPPQESRSSPFYQTSLPSMSLSASSAPRPDAYLAAGPPSYPSQQPLSRPMLPSFAELSKGLEPQSSHEYTPRPLTFQAPRPSSTDHLDHLTPLRSRPRASSSPHAPRGPPPTLNERRPGSSGLTSSWIPWDDPGKNNSPRSTLQPPTHLASMHHLESRHHHGWSPVDRSPTWQSHTPPTWSNTPPHLSHANRYHPFHREVSHSPTDQHMSLMASGGIVPAPTTRRRGKLPKDVVDHLTQWLMEHRSHPYPNEEEKRRMCHATNLNISQVSNWFINARRRILGKARHSDGGSNHGDHNSS